MQQAQIDISTAKIAYQTWGIGANTILIEPAIHACSAEWWTLAQLLSKNAKVITYDRAGYGRSSKSSLPRTADNIVQEMATLIEKLKIETPLIILAHSQGAFYAQQFARAYPNKIKGLVLIDPVTTSFPQLRFALKNNLYRKSGIDKSNTLGIAVFLGRLGLLSILKTMFAKMAPLNYIEFDKETKSYILRHKTRLASYLTAKKEQRCFYDCLPFIEDAELKPFPAVPLKVLYHNPAFMMNEMMHYGSLTKYQATEIEQHWFDMTSKAIELSPLSSFSVSRFSGNYMHLTEPEFIAEAIRVILV